MTEQPCGDTYGYSPAAVRRSLIAFPLGLSIAAIWTILQHGTKKLWILGAILGGLSALFFTLLFVVARSARERRITFDDERRVLRLENMRYWTGFWDGRRKPVVDIPYDDIRDVSFGTTRGSSSIQVRTSRGQFAVGETFERFHEIAARLHACEPADAQPRLLDRKWFQLVLGLALFVGVMGFCYVLVYRFKVFG